MADQIQLRRDTAAAWTATNPVLAQGELGIELDTNRFKIGDGMGAWSALPYAISSGGGGSGLPAGGIAGQTIVKQSSADGDVAWSIPSPIDGGTFN